jgi:hypothetical protein
MGEQDFAAVLPRLNAVSLSETVVLFDKRLFMTSFISVETHEKLLELLVFTKLRRMLIGGLRFPFPLHSISKYQEQLPFLVWHFLRHGTPPSVAQRTRRP